MLEFSLGSISSFFLELFLHWSPVAYWALMTWEFLFQYPIILPFHTVHGVLKSRILKGFAIPFSSGPVSVRPLHHDPSIFGGPTRNGLDFIELDKAVIHVIRLASCLWLWFLSICPLMPSLSAYHHTWVSLTLNVGYLFRAAPAKRSCHPLPWRWSRPSPLLPLTMDMG